VTRPNGVEDPQQVLNRWGTLPVPVAPLEVREQRRERGAVTLRAAIGSAGRERQVRRVRVAAVAVAAAALMVWGGLELFGSGPFGFGSGSLANGVATDGSRPGAAATGDAALQGKSEIWGRDRGWVLAGAGRALTAGDRVRALAEPVNLKLAKITSARVTPGSVLAIVTLEARLQELRVESGSTDFDVDPKRHAEVVVHAASARVRVKGTSFSVTSAGAGSEAWSEVVVKRGRVEVDSAGESFVLEAGESWSSRTDRPHAGRSGEVGSGQPGTMRGAGERPGHARNQSVVAGSAVAGSAVAGDGRPASERKGGAESEATTLSEENRLFRSALSARNGGNGARCVALLSEFLERFPSSPLRQEAMVAHFRCLRSSGETTAARRSAARYVSEYPSGFARDEARGLVLDVAR
jgi:hypothetical protein